MKKFHFPKITAMGLALLLTASVVVISDMSCTPKPGCGTKRDHRKRKKKVKKFAPGMSYIIQPTSNEQFTARIEGSF